MTQDRKLRLVHSAPPDAEPSDEAFTEEELALAAEVRAAVERGDEPVSSSLRAAWQPGQLAGADHDALLARAFGDVEAPATAAEQHAAELLRLALEPEAFATQRAAGARVALSGSDEEGLAALAGALRAAAHPAELDRAMHERLVVAALDKPGARVARRRIAPVAMSAVAAALALAAGVFLTMQLQPGKPMGAAPGAPPMQAALIPARSTEDLFDPAAPFPREGGESARMDRIALARAADLRANRFASWGVR